MSIRTYRKRLSSHSTYARRVWEARKFRHGIVVHRALEEARPHYFMVPKIVSTDGATWLETEWCDGVHFSESPLPTEVSAATAELAVLGSFVRKYLLINRHPVPGGFDAVAMVHLARASKQQRVSRAVWRAIAQNLWECRKSQTALPGAFLSHNDFHGRNVMRGSQGLVVLDLEFARLDYRWCCVDAVRAAFDDEEFRLNVDLIRKHIWMLSILVNSAGIRFEIQVRYALIVRLLHILVDRATEDAKRKAVCAYLVDCVLPWASFELLVRGAFDMPAAAAYRVEADVPKQISSQRYELL